jgi:large repetitive protein
LDANAPVTTASPAAGTYTTVQTVTLTCSDGTGSGCDKIYYTTNGTAPTTASTVYVGSLQIASTTILKYFSKDLAGNTESVKTQTYTVDTTKPTGLITINSGATYTQPRGVTLTLTCSDNVTCYQMQFSNDNVTWSNPAAYTVTKSWNLTAGDGEKTVYVKYRDNVGNWSEIYSDAITLDATPPVNGTLTATVGPAQVTLNWSGFSDALSGIAGYRLVYNTGKAPASCSAGTLIYSGTGTSVNHINLKTGTRYYYRLCAQDGAGNTSTGATVNATP